MAAVDDCTVAPTLFGVHIFSNDEEIVPEMEGIVDAKRSFFVSFKKKIKTFADLKKILDNRQQT